MSNRGILLVDCDGIMADLASGWYARHNRLCKVCEQKLTIDRVTTWDVAQVVDCGTEVYSHLTPQVFRRIKPIRGARPVLWRLHALVQIVVVTSVTQGVAIRNERARWLRRYFPWLTNVVIASKKSSVTGDMLFDDAPHNLADHSATGLILDYPYNREYTYATRVEDWSEAEQRIREYFA